MQTCIEKHAAALACPVQCTSMMSTLAQEFPQLGLQDVSLSHLKQACTKASDYVTPADLQDFCATLGHTYAQTSSPLVQMVARNARALSSATVPPHAIPPPPASTIQVLPMHHVEPVVATPPVPVVVPSTVSAPATVASNASPSVPTSAPTIGSGLQGLLNALNNTTSK